MRTLDSAIKNLAFLACPSEDYIKYQQEQLSLKIEHAEKDEKGNPIIKDGYFVMKDVNAFVSAAKEFDEKYKNVREAQAAKQEEIDKLMEEEANVFILKIKEDDLPDTITADEFAGITFMIEDFI